MPCMQRSEGNSAGSLSSFCLCVRPRIRTQVIGLVWQNFYLLSHLCQPVRLFLFLCVSTQTFCCKSINQRDYVRLTHAPVSLLRILKSLKGKTSGSKFLYKEEGGPAFSDQLLPVVCQSLKLTGTDLKEGLPKNISRANTAQNSVSRLLLTANCRESLHCYLRGNTLCLKVCLAIISGTFIALITLMGLCSIVGLCLPAFCFQSFTELGTPDIPCLRLCCRLLSLLAHCFCAPLCHVFPVRITSHCETQIGGFPTISSPSSFVQLDFLSFAPSGRGREDMHRRSSEV